MDSFFATIDKIGINPFVFVPDDILFELFRQYGKDKGPIPVSGSINGELYKQTLVKYAGAWRLYINTSMLKSSPNRIGERVEIEIMFDPSDRAVEAHPKLLYALDNNPAAKAKFDSLTPSLQKEIVRYISFLKTEKSIDQNVSRAISFLMGKASFIGRKPLQ